MSYFMPIILTPILGRPALVQWSRRGGQFEAYFMDDRDGLDLASALHGKLFLQTLADTRTIVQEVARAENYPDLLIPARWPQSVRDRLIPLEVASFTCLGNIAQDVGIMIGQRVQANWMHLHFTYRAVLRLSFKSLSNVELPQLFNLVQIDTEATPSRINFHSVCLHSNDWRNFAFLQITDTHIAWRNDFIAGRIHAAMGDGFPQNFINFNDAFRKFISEANALYKAHEIDFILLTGDIVDFNNIEVNYLPAGSPALFAPGDNIEFFIQLVTGWRPSTAIPASEELQVPIFTCLGNHDYRFHEYPLIGTVTLGGGAHLYSIREFDKFGLSSDEAVAFMGNREFDQDEAMDFIDHGDINRVCPLLNPSANFAIPLGDSRIVCLSTGPDSGNPDSLLGYILGKLGAGGREVSRFLAGKQYADGLTNEQIGWLDTQFVRTLQGKQKQKRGVVIVAGHAPVVNWNGTDKNPIGPLVYEGARNDKYDMGAIAHNFDEFMAVAFAHHLKQIELILCGHTHEHVESIISPSHPKRGLGIRVEASGPDWGTKFFSDSLADASDKGAWWVQHGVLQIETPCLFPKIDMLRVAVEDGVISSIKGKPMPDQTPV